MCCVRECRNGEGAREMLGDESRLQWFEHGAPAPPHMLKSIPHVMVSRGQGLWER